MKTATSHEVHEIGLIKFGISLKMFAHLQYQSTAAAKGTTILLVGKLAKPYNLSRGKPENAVQKI